MRQSLLGYNSYVWGMGKGKGEGDRGKWQGDGEGEGGKGKGRCPATGRARHVRPAQCLVQPGRICHNCPRVASNFATPLGLSPARRSISLRRLTRFTCALLESPGVFGPTMLPVHICLCASASYHLPLPPSLSSPGSPARWSTLGSWRWRRSSTSVSRDTTHAWGTQACSVVAEGQALQVRVWQRVC